MNINQKIYRATYYILGLAILALGLALNAKTGLGVPPITSLPYTVAEILQINFGNTVFLSYLIFIAIELALTKQPSERILIILQIPPILSAAACCICPVTWVQVSSVNPAL